MERPYAAMASTLLESVLEKVSAELALRQQAETLPTQLAALKTQAEQAGVDWATLIGDTQND